MMIFTDDDNGGVMITVINIAMIRMMKCYEDDNGYDNDGADDDDL